MDYTFELRYGTAAEWLAKNPVLAEGEPGVEGDTERFKIGDGARPWTALPYYINKDAITDYVNQMIESGPEELPDLTLLWENAKA